MADETKPPTPAPAKKVDLVSEIGTLTYPRAVKHFGKEKALEVMHNVARIAGHGQFEDAQFASPLFGGLAMPGIEVLHAPTKADFAHLPEADFWFQSAVEEFEVIKEQALSARNEINDYYAGLK